MLDTVTQLVVQVDPDMNWDDVRKLMTEYSNVEKAQADFVAGKMSFPDFCECLAANGVAMDSYGATIQDNLGFQGVIL
jgi:hypothetical protein